MNRFRTFLLAPILLAAVLTSVDAGSVSVRTGPFPKTKDGIHLEMVFNYQLTEDQLSQETGAVDLVWGSSWATLPPGMYNSAYIPFSVDNFTNTVAWYQANHPDWLEYRCDRKTLAFEFGSTTNAPLDFSNPQVRAYQWATWIDAPLAAGYQSIAVDTLTLTNDWQRCGHFNTKGRWVRQYSEDGNDAVFRADVFEWEAATYKHVHKQSKTATMQVNVSYNFLQPQSDNERLMSTADLLFDERGFTNWGDTINLPTPEEWSTIVTELQTIQSKGLCYMINGQEPGASDAITPAERAWAIGNYLLVKNDCTYMYMTGQQDYGKLIVFSEYAAPVGRPKGVMTQKGSVWSRHYSNGLVFVNPSHNAASVHLPHGSWHDLEGNSIGGRQPLGPQTALVAIKG